MSGAAGSGPGRALVIMGVSGSGKSTVAAGIAMALGLDFADADDFHPESNRLKMAAGTPLTDDDRIPWLDEVGHRLSLGDVAMACSALKRSYRDRLRAVEPDAVFVLLDGDRDLLAERLGRRQGHFMPASLLASQLETLERPDADEDAIVVDVAPPAAEVVAEAVRQLESR